MRPQTLLVLLTALITLALTACTKEGHPAGPVGLEIHLAPDTPGQAPCRIERIARIDQNEHGLYRVFGDSRYRLASGETRNIPIQILFRGMEGVVSDTAITLTDFETTCDQVAIEWTIEYCQDHDRSDMDCPPFEIQGSDAFRRFDLNFEGD